MKASAEILEVSAEKQKQWNEILEQKIHNSQKNITSLSNIQMDMTEE